MKTPKSGLLRHWILLSERSKITTVIIGVVLTSFVIRAAFLTSSENEFELRHSLTVVMSGSKSAGSSGRVRRVHEDSPVLQAYRCVNPRIHYM